ncbi:MAG TPA: hypothetical protein VMT42_07775 [candidate division Zixibacteria bacterium]|nr:hypothetical protein [candidate division Zixibacteria bacterium]
MAKNITLALPDVLANQMEKMPEVNWSAVAKTCIQQYIELRKNPDMSSLLEKLVKQKGEEYVNGRKKADELANELGYKGLNVLLRKYWKKREPVEAEEATGGPAEPWVTLPSQEDTLQEVLSENNLVKTEASDEFLKGLRERLSEIEKALSQ